MAEALHCYRCGSSLAKLTLPLARQDECPNCTVYLHVCRMCVFYDPQVPKQCREDDAEDVTQKERPNFCDWFKPASGVFDAKRFEQGQLAESQLAGLFGDGDASAAEPDAQLDDAENLFK